MDANNNKSRVIKTLFRNFQFCIKLSTFFFFFFFVLDLILCSQIPSSFLGIDASNGSHNIVFLSSVPLTSTLFWYSLHLFVRPFFFYKNFKFLSHLLNYSYIYILIFIAFSLPNQSTYLILMHFFFSINGRSILKWKNKIKRRLAAKHSIPSSTN